MTARTAQPFAHVLPPPVQIAIPYFLLILVVLIAYSDTFENALLYDDLYLIEKNEYLRHWSSLGRILGTYVNSGAFRYGQFYRPLQNILYLIVYQLFGGPDTVGFHLLNISLHAINACLCYGLGCTLRFDRRWAFVASLVWALHPIHTEAVTYMSGTADLIYVGACLWGLVILTPDFAPKKFYRVVLIFVVGLLGKETTIIFPMLVVATMFLAMPMRFKLKIYLRTWPLWLVAAFYLACRLVFVPFHGETMVNIDPMSQQYASHILLRIWTFLATVPAYLQLIVWPVGLHMDRAFPVYETPWFWQVAAGVLIVASAIAQICWGKGQRGAALSWGLMWFSVAQIPQSGIFIPVNSLFLEHWMYMPAVGLFLGLGQTIGSNLTHKDSGKAALVILTVVAAILGKLTYTQNKVWADPITFYSNILDHGETSERAHNNLGIAYMDAGYDNAAMKQFRASMEVHDLSPETHQDIASLLSKLPGDHIDQEISELKRALEIKDDFLPAVDGLAELYEYQGNKLMADTYRGRADAIRQKFKQ